MIRIRYAKGPEENTLVSTSTFSTPEGYQLALKLTGNTDFIIYDAITGQGYGEGKSNKGSSTYLRRLAKRTLLALLDETTFTKEVRKKRL